MTVKASDIEVLEGLAPVRERPGMYIGPVNSPHGIFNWAREPIDNVIDEWAAGRNEVLYVEASKDRLLVADQGIGIPVEKHPKKKLSTLTVVFTTLHAGAKFSRSKSYKAGKTTGMHGVGVSVTNALSSSLEVYTYRKNSWWFQEFSRGEPITKVKKVKKPPIKRWTRGTIVIAQPDPAIFRKQAIPLNLLKEFLFNLQFLCPGLKITFNGETWRFKGKHGLKELLLTKVSKEKFFTKIFTYEEDKLKCSLGWAEYEEPQIFSFVNYLRTRGGGTHVDGLKDAVVKAIKDLDKKASSLTQSDLLLGFCAALHVHTENPSFDSQTKDRLDTPEVKDLVREKLYAALRKFFAENKAALSKVVRRARKAKEAREAFRREVVEVKKVSKEVRSKKLPPKLLVAASAPPRERELFIVEGDSALVSGREARDKRYQEVLPIRGKTLNITRVDVQRVIKNEELKNILLAIGAGFGENCNPRKARVGRVILLTDADADGAHIQALLLTFFAKFQRPLIEEGMLFVADTPLYVARKKDKKVYGYTLDDVKRKLGSLNGAVVTRMKGWAEASADDLREIAMDPRKRLLWQVRISGKDLVVLERVMGSDTYYRKQLLLKEEE